MQSPAKITGTLLRDGGTWVAVLPRLELMARAPTEDLALDRLLGLVRRRVGDHDRAAWVQRMDFSEKFSVWGEAERLNEWVAERATLAANGYDEEKTAVELDEAKKRRQEALRAAGEQPKQEAKRRG